MKTLICAFIFIFVTILLISRYACKQLNIILTSIIFILDNIVLRIPVLYGDVEYLEESAITVLFKNLKDVQGINELKQLEQILIISFSYAI